MLDQLMNSLFWKIFITFWFALILFTALSLTYTSHYLKTTRSEIETNQPRTHLQNHIAEVNRIAQSQGIDAVRKWLIKLDHEVAVPHLLIDENGNDLLKREVPNRILRRVNRRNAKYDYYSDDSNHAENGNHDDHEYKRRTRHRPIIIDHMRYHLVPDHRSITLDRVLNRPKVITIPLIVATLISGIICFLLARYLTSPLSRLRAATSAMAKGNLDYRVAHTMGRRKDEIVELAIDFDNMATQLQKLLSSHKQLLRDASHELRSPLARLQVALGLAQKKSNGEIDKELSRIELETERLNELIGQLLSLARLETNTSEIQFEKINLATLLTEVVDDAQYEAVSKKKQVNLKNKVDCQIKGNPMLLKSAMENVIRNAIRHTEVNTSVDITMQAGDNNQMLIQIKDHGPGIEEDMIDKIFEPFVRTSSARDRQSGGYGLGLTIAKRAINLHKGEITAKNNTESGMSVLIQLPYNEAIT